MGLFGTIVGMIEIFGSRNPMSGNPAQLAHGISVALYNTLFGIRWRSLGHLLPPLPQPVDGLVIDGKRAIKLIRDHPRQRRA
jgi:biopolymer transport protein ExbB